MKNTPALWLVLALNLSSAVAGDWPMLGHDPGRTGGTGDEIRPPFARKWYRLFPDEGIQSGVQPVVSGNKVFIGTLAGVLHALDTDTGHEAWRFQSGGPFCMRRPWAPASLCSAAPMGASTGFRPLTGSWRGGSKPR
jgi:hypothetical protein